MPVIDEWARPRPPELPNKQAIEAVIAAARASAVAANLQKVEEEARELAKAEERVKQMEKRQARKEKEKQKPAQSKEEKEALKEKKLKKMVGAVVVKTMSKYQKYMDHDQFKKYAKEVRHPPSCPSPPLADRSLADGDYFREGEEVFKL
jgi:histone-lysine N-methyltransferase SETD2